MAIVDVLLAAVVLVLFAILAHRRALRRAAIQRTARIAASLGRPRPLDHGSRMIH